MTSVDQFYVVLKSDDHCLRRHDGFEEAIQEAKRLAEKEKGRFFVLKTHRCYEYNPIVELDLNTPF